MAIVVVLGFNEAWLIARDPITARDDESLLTPLRQVHGLGGYVRALVHHRVMDVQPVRDLSFLADIELGRLFHVSTFHATNVLLLIAILLLAAAILRRLGRSQAAIAVALLWYAAHPVIADTVSWISARKHLLAAVFILAATLVVLRTELASWRARLGSLGLYLLSVFAQPITLLWPCWAAFELVLRGRRRDAVKTLALFAPVTAAVALINLAYYRGAYVRVAGPKLSHLSWTGFSVSLLSLGRDVFNAVCPIAVATAYDPGRIFNLIGLVLLPLFVWASVRLLNRRQALSAWAIFAFPLVPVTAWMTNIFVSDTYLVVPLVAFSLLLAMSLDALTSRAVRRVTAMAVAALALVAAVESHAVAASWESTEALWARAYRVEATPRAVGMEAYYELRAGHIEAGDRLVRRLIAWDPRDHNAPTVFAMALAADTRLSAQEKIDALKAYPVQNAWTQYGIGALQAQAGLTREAWRHLSEIVGDPTPLGKFGSAAAAEGLALCRGTGASGCDRWLETMKRKLGAAWDPKAFRQKEQALGIR